MNVHHPPHCTHKGCRLEMQYCIQNRIPAPYHTTKNTDNIPALPLPMHYHTCSKIPPVLKIYRQSGMAVLTSCTSTADLSGTIIESFLYICMLCICFYFNLCILLCLQVLFLADYGTETLDATIRRVMRALIAPDISGGMNVWGRHGKHAFGASKLMEVVNGKL